MSASLLSILPKLHTSALMFGLWFFLLLKSFKFSLFCWPFKYVMRKEHVLFLALLFSKGSRLTDHVFCVSSHAPFSKSNHFPSPLVYQKARSTVLCSLGLSVPQPKSYRLFSCVWQTFLVCPVNVLLHMNAPEYALIASKRYGVRAMFVCGYRILNSTAIYRMWQERRHVFRVLFLFSVSPRHLYIVAAKFGHTVFKCDCSSWM